MKAEREALRESIDAHKAALAKVAQCKATLQKAQNLACALSAEAAEFQNLDGEMALARAEKFKLALANGEDRFDIAEPEGFASRLVARENVQERLETVRGALPTLERELENAEQAATDSDFARERAAEKVLAVETEVRAVAHLENITALRREHYAITALATRYVRHPPTMNSAGQLGTVSQRRAQMPGAVHGAAMENILGDCEARGGMRVRHAMGLAAQAFWNALKENADAEFSDFEPQDDTQKQDAE